MRSNKFILALDFDQTLTMQEGFIPKTWGDRLATAIRRVQRKCPLLEIFVLSAANANHILHLVALSGSNDLVRIMSSIPFVTNENRNLFHLNHEWKETSKGRKEMIEKLAHTTPLENLELIVAYKKTNYLIHKSMETGIPHSHIYLVDDNYHNIRFAKYHGFQTMSVDNHNPSTNIFQRLQEIEKKMSGLCLQR